MCIPDRIHGLSLAWVTSENSTMLLESDILRLFFTGPYLVSSPLCSVSGVDCPSVDPRQPLCSPLSCPAETAFSLLSSHQLFLLLSNYQLSFSGPATNSFCSCPTTNSHSRVQPPTLSAPVQLPTASLWSLPLSGPVSTALRGLQPQLPSLLSSHQLSLSLLSNYQLLLSCPAATPLSVASSTLIRLPVPLPGTARFHVQESFVWFRAKTDN